MPPSSVVLDAIVDAAGNAIQVALQNFKVLAIELSKKRLGIAKNNAGVYGVANDVEFILGNAFHFIPALKDVDAVLSAPSWGGLECLEKEAQNLKRVA